LTAFSLRSTGDRARRLIFVLDATAGRQETWESIFAGVTDENNVRDPPIRLETRVLVDYQWTNAQSDNKLGIA